jgi:glycosyltransferase involved in cell wall biosynthesis
MLRMRAKPLQGRPLVSVVIPCYNYGHFLPEAVASVLEQPDVDVEVIIVDDASTDHSAEVAESLTSDPRVGLVRHKVNQGHIATYNDGL